MTRSLRSRKTDEQTKVAIRFDLTTYLWIKARAAKDKTSFSSVAADAAKCGILCITESEAEDNAH